MNKLGQVGFLSLMLAIVFFLLGLALAPPLNDVVQGDGVRGANGYDCANVSISSQDKALCTQTDLIPPFFVAIILGLGGMLLGRIV